jgi:hypothetical protein
MRTARMLEAAWRQVLRVSVSTEAKEDESSTGRVWTAGFHHVTIRSRLSGVLKYEPFISLIFQFFSGRGELRILNQWIKGHTCTQDRVVQSLQGQHYRTETEK